MNKKIENEILNKLQQYVKTVNDINLDLASDLWLNSDTVSYIHPRGHEQGFDEVIQNLYINTMQSKFKKRKLTILDTTIQIYNNTVIAEFYWDFVAEFRDTGDTHNTKGRESQVYIKDNNNEWKLVNVHYSNMPVTGPKEGF